MKSLKFKLQIQCDNDAFADEPGAEIARILRLVAKALATGYLLKPKCNLYDINGNLVGECSLKAVRVQS